MFKARMMVVGVIAALVTTAIPAVAAASWSHQTTKVATEQNITLSGTFSTSSVSGGFGCSTGDMTATLVPGTTGFVTSFESPAATCKYTGGFSGCAVTSVTGTKLPWTIHSTTTTIEITGIEIDTRLHGAFCPYHDLRLKGTMTATPDNLHAMTQVALTNTPTSSGPPHVPGGLEFFNGTNGLNIAAIVLGDTLSVTPSGTFGIT